MPASPRANAVRDGRTGAGDSAADAACCDGLSMADGDEMGADRCERDGDCASAVSGDSDGKELAFARRATLRACSDWALADGDSCGCVDERLAVDAAAWRAIEAVDALISDDSLVLGALLELASGAGAAAIASVARTSDLRCVSVGVSTVGPSFVALRDPVFAVVATCDWLRSD